jgi:hypothetical protein
MFLGNWVVIPPVQDGCHEFFLDINHMDFGVSNRKK